MRQIVLNLLTNAIKFTPEGGRCPLSVAADPQRGIFIRVADTGIGIAPEDIARVIRPFEQVETVLVAHPWRHRPRTAADQQAHRTAWRQLSTSKARSAQGTTVTVVLPAETPARVRQFMPLQHAG